MPVPPHGFNCSRRAERGGSIRLLLAGELDLAVSSRFRSALDAAQTDSHRVLLDFGALTLIDCAGLTVLFAAAERSHCERTVLILLGPRGQVRRLLDLVGTPDAAIVLDHDDLLGAEATVTA